MRKFIKNLSLFFIPAGILYVLFSLFVLPRILERFYGPNIDKQLSISFENAQNRNYEMVILGNSRLYCGADPDEFDIPTFNFAHNNDSYNQMFYKLKWLWSVDKKIKYMVLGIDYFQFGIFSETRNYAYGKFLPREYLEDYPKRNYSFWHYIDLMRPEKIQNLLLRPVYKHDIKSNGQFIRVGEADSTDFIKRNVNKLPVQLKYFKMILEFCKMNNVHVFICMPPLRDVERQQYSKAQIDEFNAFLTPFLNNNVRFLDFSTDSSFTMKDFIDISHLSQNGAVKFSQLLSERIALENENPTR